MANIFFLQTFGGKRLLHTFVKTNPNNRQFAISFTVDRIVGCRLSVSLSVMLPTIGIQSQLSVKPNIVIK
jgi:hypothetical protein